MFDDEVGLRNHDLIGMDQICFETDYPHADSTFPHSEKVERRRSSPRPGWTPTRPEKFLRGNAIRCFKLDERYGIDQADEPTSGERSSSARPSSRSSSRTRATRSPTTAGTSATTSTPAAWSGRGSTPGAAGWRPETREDALRAGTRPDLFGDGDPGTYLAIYFVIAGKHAEHFDWELRQVKSLHANDRMFKARDHIHTLLYNHGWAVGRDADGVPPELALDHPYTSLVVQFVERADGVD